MFFFMNYITQATTIKTKTYTHFYTQNQIRKLTNPAANQLAVRDESLRAEFLPEDHKTTSVHCIPEME